MPDVITRIERTPEPFLVPRLVEGQSSVALVDRTWGTIQPMQVAEGVRTVSEVEVIAHLVQGLLVIDSRTQDFYVASTIPGAKNIPYPEVVERMDEFDRERLAIFFCNGPQCGQSPTAIHALLETGYPPEKILYYRGGMHDWITLGLPVEPGDKNQPGMH